MNALFRKELRQILPAQLFLAMLFAFVGWSTLDPDAVLAPYDENQWRLHAIVACFYLAEGLVLGLGQFAAERWQGTEAYLVHRGTGREGAFRAKAGAAIVSLLLLVVIPSAVFGAIHLSQHPYAGSASIGRLVQVMAAGCTAFAGYGLGALISQVDRSLACRALLALSGSVSLLVFLLVGVLPTGPEAAPSVLRHLTVQLGVTCALLWSARHGFVQTPTTTGMRSRTVAWARSALAVGMFALPFVLVPFVVQSAVNSAIREREPEIVADEAGALYIATPTELDRDEIGRSVPAVYRYGTVYEIADQEGRPVDAELAVQYTGSFRSERPFHGVFASHMLSTPRLGQENPADAWRGVAHTFVFGGRWIERRIDNGSWCFNMDTGEHWVRRHETDILRGIHSEPEPSWRRLDERTPRAAIVMGVSRTGNSAVVLLTDDETRPRTLEGYGSGREPGLVEIPLPDGDRIVGRELLIQADLARVGLRGFGRWDLFRGERGRYVWNGERWVVWSATEGLDRMGYVAADEAPQHQRWAVDVTPIDGLAYRVEVSDTTPGGAHLELAVDSATFLQRRLAEAASLLFPPIVAVPSWLSPQGEPKRALHFAVGLDEIDLLRGRRHTWILLTVVGLALLLARDLWRRLNRGGAALELRFLWCGATLLLGLPAYVLCRLSEPRARLAPRVVATPLKAVPRFEIVTA